MTNDKGDVVKIPDIALGRSEGKYALTMKSGRIFDVDSFRKNPWTSAFRKAKLPYKVPYTMRHSFAAWALTLRMDPNRLVNLMGHCSKKMQEIKTCDLWDFILQRVSWCRFVLIVMQSSDHLYLRLL